MNKENPLLVAQRTQPVPERRTGAFCSPEPGLADPLGLRRQARHPDPGVEPRGWRKWWDEAVSNQDGAFCIRVQPSWKWGFPLRESPLVLLLQNVKESVLGSLGSPYLAPKLRQC